MIIDCLIALAFLLSQEPVIAVMASVLAIGGWFRTRSFWRSTCLDTLAVIVGGLLLGGLLSALFGRDCDDHCDV